MDCGGSARDRRRAGFLVTTTEPSGANEASPILHAVDAAGVAFAMALPIGPPSGGEGPPYRTDRT